jgi:exodeoxyribonuclease VII small subunit
VPDEDPSDPGFDGVMARLRDVVTQLETGQLTLEQALAIYEEGVTLARRGHELLDRAEQRVEVLVAGDDRLAPLGADREAP